MRIAFVMNQFVLVTAAHC